MFQVNVVNIMGSENCIKRRHYTISAKLVAVYRTDRSSNRNAWIINEILTSDNVISVKAINL
jgi:hypothetical protein